MIEKPVQRAYMPLKGTLAFKAIEARAKLYRHIRSYLDAQGYIEVDTPILYPRPEVAPMEQLMTQDPISGSRLFLRVCPTEHLKRLLVAGFHAVYELSRNFRPALLSPHHLCEFTSLECTKIGATYKDMMELTEELVVTAVTRMTGKTLLTWAGCTVDLRPPWPRITVREAVHRYTGIDLDNCPDLNSLKAECRKVCLPASSDHYESILEDIINMKVLPNLDGPIFLTEYPWLLGGPAAPVGERPQYKQRCEFFIGSFELANMSTHLNDPDALLAWHQVTLNDKARLGIGHIELDEYLMRDIRLGLPPSAIVGIGLDRLLMLILGIETIDDVVAFPTHLVGKGVDDEHGNNERATQKEQQQ